MAKYETGLNEACSALEGHSRKGENMTNEEAIEQIKNIKIFAIKDGWYTNETIEALNVAIKNIEAWKDIKKEVTKNNIADFIAVQSVLDIINKHLKEVENE